MQKILLFCFCFFYTQLFAQTPLQEVKKDLTPFFQSNTFTSLQDAFQQPEKVIVLDLGDQKIQKLPAEIGTLKNLQRLILYGNALTQLPPEIGLLTELLYLDLYNNQLRDLPQEISQLQKLTRLDVGWNQLKKIPTPIFELKNLKELYLYGNRIKEIDPKITQLNHLESLRLGKGLKFLWGGNHLRELPENMGELRNLQELYIPDNALRSLPNSFIQLKRLKYLDLVHNRFRQIPPQLNELDSLQTVLMWDRGFEKTAIETLKKTKVVLEKRYEGTLWGIVAGLQQGKQTVGQLGVARAFRKDILVIATAFSAEINTNGKMYGATLSGWLNGLTIFSTGLHASYYQEKIENDWRGNVALRPEFGLGWGMFHLNYGYNILFRKSSQNINKHLVSLRVIFPISPHFSVFK